MTLSEKQIADIIYQVLLAVNYSHQNDITHRDFHPSNIYIRNINSNSYLDIACKFGTVYSYDLRRYEGEKNKDFLIYMAPEVFENDSVDKCVDMWSIGVLTYMLFEGKSPFKIKAYTGRIAQYKLDISSKRIKESSSLAKDFIKSLLVKEPEKRLNAFDALNHKWFSMFSLIEKHTVIEKSKLEKFMSNMYFFGNDFKLKQLCVALIVHSLTDDDDYDIKMLQKAFTSFDINKNGKISKEELVNGMKSIFKNRNSESLEMDGERIFLKIDLDKNGELDYIELISACIDKNLLLQEKYLRYAFYCFDQDGNGLITCYDFKNVLSGRGQNLITKELLLNIMNEINLNENMKMNFLSFKSLRRK